MKTYYDLCLEFAQLCSQLEFLMDSKEKTKSEADIKLYDAKIDRVDREIHELKDFLKSKEV
jgi:hypothetical protein